MQREFELICCESAKFHGNIYLLLFIEKGETEKIEVFPLSHAQWLIFRGLTANGLNFGRTSSFFPDSKKIDRFNKAYIKFMIPKIMQRLGLIVGGAVMGILLYILCKL